MEQQIIDIDSGALQGNAANPGWIAAVEAGKVLHFPQRPFALQAHEQAFLTPGVRDLRVRSISLCFSDQTSHAVMSGQYLLEQTFHLPADAQYDTASSPLALLTRLTGRTLI
jgi:hypothetical protein